MEGPRGFVLKMVSPATNVNDGIDRLLAYSRYGIPVPVTATLTKSKNRSNIENPLRMYGESRDFMCAGSTGAAGSCLGVRLEEVRSPRARLEETGNKRRSRPCTPRDRRRDGHPGAKLRGNRCAYGDPSNSLPCPWNTVEPMYS